MVAFYLYNTHVKVSTQIAFLHSQNLVCSYGLSFFPPNVEREQSPVLVPICASDSRVRVLVV